MDSHLVQHDDSVLFEIIQQGIELVVENVVTAFHAHEEVRIVGGRQQIEIGNAVCDVLAARIVVESCGADAFVDEKVHDVSFS